MPYFIKSPKLLDRFPHNCPYCGISSATTQFKQTFSKLKMAKIPVHAESVSIVSSLPGCASCAEWFRKTRMMMIIFWCYRHTGYFLGAGRSYIFKSRCHINRCFMVNNISNLGTPFIAAEV